MHDFDFDVARSLKQMRTVGVNDIEDNFTFVVGGKTYDSSRIIAELVLPTACLGHSVDPSITNYIVETNDCNGNFELFQSLCTGSTIRVTEANRVFLLSLSREFGNFYIPLSILRHFHTSYPVGQIYDHFGDCSLPFLALKFFELTSSELDSIPVSALYHILSHTLLKLTSEDSLYLYLSSHFSSDPEYLSLLDLVRIEYLSPECLSDFISTIADSIGHRLWESILDRLISPREVEFPLKDPTSLEGIIHCLSERHGGNVHDKGIVTITSQSVWKDNPEFGARNLADLTSGSQFCSKDGPGQWICWDFPQKRVRLSHYTIRSQSLKSWVVEGSLDGEAWTELDRKTNSTDLYGGRLASFAISNSVECRFIRLTQTNMNHARRNSLDISTFEFFGTLLE
jgi:hypothetical protein